MGKRNPRKARDRSQCRCGGVGSGQRAVGGAAGGGQQAGSKQSAAGSRQQTAGSGQRAAGSGQQAAAGREQRAEGSEQQASECIAKIEVRFVHPEPETQSLSCPLRPATDSLKATERRKVLLWPRRVPSSSRKQSDCKRIKH